MNTNVKYCILTTKKSKNKNIANIPEGRWTIYERQILSNNQHLMPGKYTFDDIVQKVRMCAGLLGNEGLDDSTSTCLIEAIGILSSLCETMNQMQVLFIKYV